MFGVKPQPGHYHDRGPSGYGDAGRPVPRSRNHCRRENQSHQREPPAQRAGKILAVFSRVGRKQSYQRPQGQSPHVMSMAPSETESSYRGKRKPSPGGTIIGARGLDVPESNGLDMWRYAEAHVGPIRGEEPVVERSHPLGHDAVEPTNL
jgi:hypothetical protein